MPGRDGTGPLGLEPRGACGGIGAGRGLGLRHGGGCGLGFRAGAADLAGVPKERLLIQKERLERQLNLIERQLESR